MNILLISGLGPSIKNSQYLSGTYFDTEWVPGPDQAAFDPRHLVLSSDGIRKPLLQPRREGVPHLTTFTLRQILAAHHIDHDWLDAEAIWTDAADPDGQYDLVMLSTTFIWEWRALCRAVRWISERWPAARIVLGGQYSNLKFARIVRELPQITLVVRGDGEEAMPALIHALEAGSSIGEVPNLVWGEDGRMRFSPMRNADIEAHPSPGFGGRHHIVPYESMRGCPFSCGFCSFPHASPEWRYKSAEKVAGDWRRYADASGTTLIKAMDSTFTVPPRRLRQLFELLPTVGVQWEAYSRANAIKTEADVDMLAAAHCRSLSIGFESMSDRSLTHMDKKVTAAHNRRAFELLSGSAVGFRCSFMAGYPGETPDDFALTRDFLVHEYAGQFMLAVFSVQDETMPVWQQADRFGLRASDPNDMDYTWSHIGMDEPTARALVTETLDEVRRVNENAVVVLWQGLYDLPLIPGADMHTNRRVEKLVDRLGMLPRDAGPGDFTRRATSLLADLETFGVRLAGDA